MDYQNGFLPHNSHVKEAISLLKGGIDTIGRNYVTRFLNQHPELVAKLSSSSLMPRPL